MAVQSKPDQPVFVSPEEYLAFERASEFRHEYHGGEVVAMSGATLAHNRLTRNLVTHLTNALRGGSCEAFTGDMRVGIPRSRRYFYPDITAVCGEPEFEDGVLDTLLNPVLVVEVLSESTEGFDRGEKFLRYQRIESLREYVLVSQTSAVVERFARAGEDWTYHAALGRDATITLESVGVTLRLADVYEGVETPGDDRDDERGDTPPDGRDGN